MYFRSASGKLLEYDGDRTKEDMINFIEKNRDITTPQETPQETPKDEL
jgi:protein disulfide-isomerase A1